MLIDSHAHIDSEELDCAKIIANMKNDNLEKIVTIGTDLKHSKSALKVANENEDIYCTVGIHPEYAEEYNAEDLREIDVMCNEKKVVAVGEIGLDYYYSKENKDKQKELFVKQLEIANKHNLPVALHIRDAIGDALQILNNHKDLLKNGGIMHCFSGSKEVAEQVIKLGFYISFSGTITFKSTNREILKSIPIDRILVETDCPYLSPEPVRGTINEPKNVNHTARKIAEYLNIDFEEFCKITTKNCKKIYKID